MNDDALFDAVLVRARALEAAGDLAGPVRLLEAEVRVHPDDPEAQFWLGRYLVAHDADRAQRVLEAAAQIEPQQPWFTARVASQFARLRQPNRAVHFVTVAARLMEAQGGPTDRFFEGFLWETLGEVAVLKGDHATAEESFRSAIDSAPEEAIYVSDLARLLVFLGRDSEARELVQNSASIVEDPSPILKFLDGLPEQ